MLWSHVTEHAKLCRELELCTKDHRPHGIEG